MVKGLDRLKRKLTKSIPERVRKNTEEALKRAARSITDTMEAFAPQDTGRLKGSIGWTMGEPPPGSISSKRKSEPGDIAATIYAGDESTMVTNKRGVRFQNARLQEFGTKNMPPTPFFYPAYRAHKKSVKSRVSRAIKKGLKEGAK